MPWYFHAIRTSTGDELVLTNYLNVELKKESDYSLLREKAMEYNLVITEQDKFMPRWYILSITPNTGKNIPGGGK